VWSIGTTERVHLLGADGQVALPIHSEHWGDDQQSRMDHGMTTTPTMAQHRVDRYHRPGSPTSTVG
jgi:hypothetical protein